MAGWFRPPPGALLLGETDKAIGLADRFAACFADRRLRDCPMRAFLAILLVLSIAPAFAQSNLTEAQKRRLCVPYPVVRGEMQVAND